LVEFGAAACKSDARKSSAFFIFYQQSDNSSRVLAAVSQQQYNTGFLLFGAPVQLRTPLTVFKAALQIGTAYRSV